MNSTSMQYENKHTANPSPITKMKKKMAFIKPSRPSVADSWDKEEHQVWLRRARRKYLGYSVAARLYFENVESPLRKSYRNSMYCSDAYTPDPLSEEPHVHYCNNRWCPTCGAIRCAKLIDGYKPQIEEFKELYFVTLTRPTCTADFLPTQIKEMNKAFRRIINRKSQRGKFHGIRKAECTIRPNNLYHFHYHIIIDGYENAKYIRDAWLKIFPECDIKANLIEKAKDNTLKELFKYFTKLTVCVDDNRKKRILMDFKRMDVIFQAIQGLRTVQPFGKIKKIDENVNEDELEGEIPRLSEIFSYVKEQYDWIGTRTGTPLTGYHPSKVFEDFVNGNIYDLTKPPPE